MNRETLRRLTHAHRKPGDLNRKSTHKMRSTMGMGSKVHLREAIAKKLGLDPEKKAVYEALKPLDKFEDKEEEHEDNREGSKDASQSVQPS